MYETCGHDLIGLIKWYSTCHQLRETLDRLSFREIKQINYSPDAFRPGIGGTPQIMIEYRENGQSWCVYIPLKKDKK